MDLYANDPTPIRGGRLYVHGLLGQPGVPTDADEVRNMIDTARAEFVDWQAMATGVVFWRVLGVTVWALLLGATVSFIRGRVLKDTGREVEPKTLPDGQPFIERRKRDEF